MKTKMIALCLFTSTAIAACGTIDSPVGSSFGATAPQLVQSENGLAWSNVAAFGPVPAANVEQGNATCQALQTVGTRQARAIGYHPAALDQNGNVIPNGGYYCG